MTHRYDVQTWDMESGTFTRQEGIDIPPDGLTLWQLRSALKQLRKMGYDARRKRLPGGSHVSDASVLVERM